MARHEFSIADYVVFALTIAISLGIGVYSALSGGRQRTTQEFLLGNRKLQVFPTALSLIVSFESSIMMLGYPGEMYMYGVAYWWTSVSWCVCMIIISLLMVPTFYRLQLISCYEYLEARFESRIVRLIGSFLGGMVNLWYMGIVLYGPATALQAVTGFTMWYSIVVIAIVGIIYTSIGGIKAVIWADAFQTFIMVGGMLAVIVKGTIDVGGVGKVFALNKKGGRLEFFNFDLNPTVRLTFWGLTIGAILRNLGMGTNQTSIQRIATMPTLKKAQLIAMLSGPGFLLFGTLAFVEGLVAYAYFTDGDCDPLKAGIIKNPNQIMPYFVMELFADMPGLSGLFLAALFSASLSTLSSGYASISAMVWSDWMKPLLGNMAEFKATLVTKSIVVFAGLLSMGVAVLIMQVGGPMNQISGMVLSSFAGPLSGLFLLGGLVPHANYKGAISAVTVSSVFALWKGMGSSFSPDVIRTPYLPGGSISNCNLGNKTQSLYHYANSTNHWSTTTASVLNTTLASRTGTPLATFYSISYLWISAISLVISMAVGTAVSYATGGRKKSDINPAYLMPLCDRMCCCLPDCFRRIFRFNPEEKDDDKIAMESLESPEVDSPL